jgi:O-antigen biosynthesis protein
MAKKICIVTPDIIGPIKNGGIGTACYWLARFLAQSGFEVTVLYTGPLPSTLFPEVQAKYAADHIDFLSLSEFENPNYKYHGIEYHGEISERIYAFLKKQSFDVIHFQDWQGNGFAPIQAKKMGLAFDQTVLVVGVHSPSLWQHEGMKIWPASPMSDYKLDYMEKYAIENADSVWAPSEAMFRWLDAHGIVPKGEKKLIRYLSHVEERPEQVRDYTAKDPSHLVFFGRLETRKGLELFTNAINQLLQSKKEHGIGRITFLGKVGTVQNDANAVYYLNQMAGTWKANGIEWKVVDTMDAFQAIRYIKKTGAIAVLPSLSDNYPYTVLECIENQIPCLASSVGGIPEMLSPEVIFDPTVDSLCDALYNRDARTRQMRSPYSNEQAKADWLAYSNSLEAKQPVSGTATTEPRVSVCVSYHNYGVYLPQLLASLERNDYPNFEVIVVDDGSTDPFSIQVFDEQQKKFSSCGWKFARHANQGPGATRNAAASLASGEHLIFMDADNVATEKMISTFVKSLIKSGADALTCIARVFKGDDVPNQDTPVDYLYRPLGPVLEIGMIENVFGDTNAIVRKTVFDELGGFGTDKSTNCEDWEFLALVALRGHTIDVLPEQLFFYRYHEKGFSKRTNAVENQKRVVNAFLKHADKIDLKQMLHRVLVPFYFSQKASVEDKVS